MKNTYKSVDEYLGIFEPLLFEEVKAQIIRGSSDDDEEGWAAELCLFSDCASAPLIFFDFYCLFHLAVFRGSFGLAEGSGEIGPRV